MGLGIVWIIELSAAEAAGDIFEQFFRFGDSAGHALSCRCQDDLCAVGFEQALPLLAHIFRHRQDDLVALDRAYQSQTHTGIAAGRFDDGRTRLDVAPFFRLLQHVISWAVLDAAARIEKFNFSDDLCRQIFCQMQLYHRRLADQLTNVIIYHHEYLR